MTSTPTDRAEQKCGCGGSGWLIGGVICKCNAMHPDRVSDSRPLICERCGKSREVTIDTQGAALCVLCREELDDLAPSESQSVPVGEGAMCDPLPCPWCGVVPNGPTDFGGGEDEVIWFIHCHECAIDGPSGATPAEAIAAWNERPDRLRDERSEGAMDMPIGLHRCKECGALWRAFADAWSLWPGEKCGKCCDNESMGEQIEFLGIIETHPPVRPSSATKVDVDALAEEIVAEWYDAPLTPSQRTERVAERIYDRLLKQNGTLDPRGVNCAPCCVIPAIADELRKALGETQTVPAPAEVKEPTCARDRDDLPEPPLKDDGRPSAKICVCGHRHGDGIVSARKCPRAGCDCQAFASCRPATPPESAPSDAETCDHAALRNVQCGPCGTPALAVNALAVKRARTSASSYAVELREIAALIHTSASRDRDDGEDAAADQKRGWADRVLALAAKMEGSR
jgi:hypothetical protein